MQTEKRRPDDPACLSRQAPAPLLLSTLIGVIYFGCRDDIFCLLQATNKFNVARTGVILRWAFNSSSALISIQPLELYALAIGASWMMRQERQLEIIFRMVRCPRTIDLIPISADVLGHQTESREPGLALFYQ